MIRLVYNAELGECDLAQAEDGGIAEGDELLTAVLVSLFTDRHVGPDEVPPGGARAGWWGDAYPDDEDDGPIGSRLWLLEQHGQLGADAPLRAREYALEALAWMVKDGVARAVDVEAVRNGRGRLDLTITITMTDGSVRTYEVS